MEANTEVPAARVSDWLGSCFWIGAALSAFATFAVGVRNDWLTLVTFFAAYILGAVGGLFFLFIVLRIPPVRQRWDAEGTSLTYVDLLTPYFIVGVLASIFFAPFSCKHPRFAGARKYQETIRSTTPPNIRPSGYPQNRQVKIPK
jgi:hypothetical protein